MMCVTAFTSYLMLKAEINIFVRVQVVSCGKIVVHDFACAVQDYCLNRYPTHVKKTLFMIDNSL